MIRNEEVYKIGTITKTHGVNGELNMSFTDDVFDREDADYVVLKIDGILVPFFLEEYRFRSDNVALVKLEGIDTQQAAAKLCGTDVYFPKALTSQVQEGEYTWSYFTGFSLVDSQAGKVGEITAVDDSTMNILFEVATPQGDNLLIPAGEDWIDDIDHKERVIYMTLPQGLLSLHEIDE